MKWKKDEPFTSEHVVRGHGWWTGPVGRLVAHGLWNTEIIGKENLPRTGPAIVASNHTGVADGPLVHAAMPREVYTMTKKGMMQSRGGWFLRASGQFPVDRKNGRGGLQIALDLLKEGRVVVMFPEGHRGSGTGEGIKAGVAWLAQRSGAPVVPVAVLGTRPRGRSVGYIPRFRAKLYVVLGEPILRPEELPRGREGTARAMEIIEAGLEAHVARAVELTGVELPGDEGIRDEQDRFKTED
ncbi:MAG TPA: lysophospholipid acyltransferase family protein [Actinomycetaceae bacterium]|nr:lysophospholipid acyltransferase family protein [Actinomycetaceae bacterium]